MGAINSPQILLWCFLLTLLDPTIGLPHPLQTDVWKGMNGQIQGYGSGDLLALTESISRIVADTNSTSTAMVDLYGLKDRMSILEAYWYEKQDGDKNTLKFQPEQNQLPTLCKSAEGNSEAKIQVLNGIERVLKFYQAQLDQLQMSDVVIGLLFLKSVDDKNGKKFQQKFPISDWFDTACRQNSRSAEQSYFCERLREQWTANNAPWKSQEILVNKAHEFQVGSIGYEKETMWGRLNGECQGALVSRCEVPYVCERTFFDAQPQSQYMLTHQLLQRILVDMVDCPVVKRYADTEVNDRLAAKMWLEAELVAHLGFPAVHRDIFAEYVAFGGYMRHPNFFREDWLQAILAWQSRSEHGCFTEFAEQKKLFVTSDKPIKRQATKEEMEKELEVEEYCLPHFTEVGLSALTMFWDYMEDNCS